MITKYSFGQVNVADLGVDSVASVRFAKVVWLGVLRFHVVQLRFFCVLIMIFFKVRSTSFTLEEMRCLN